MAIATASQCCHVISPRSGAARENNAARSCNRRAGGVADHRLIIPKQPQHKELAAKPRPLTAVTRGDRVVTSAASLTAHHRSFESPQRVCAASERIFHLIAAFQNAELE
jgi:hypothetical protein